MLALALLLLLTPDAEAGRRKNKAPAEPAPVEVPAPVPEVIGRPVGVDFVRLPCPLRVGEVARWAVLQGELERELSLEVVGADDEGLDLLVGPPPPEGAPVPVRWRPGSPLDGVEPHLHADVGPLLGVSCTSLAVGAISFQAQVPTPFGPASATGTTEVSRVDPETIRVVRTESVDATALAEALAAAVAAGSVSPEMAAGLHGASMVTRSELTFDAQGRVTWAERVVQRVAPSATAEERTTWTLR